MAKKKVDDNDPYEIVIVVGTEKSKYLATGKEYEVTRKHSENLIKNGAATLK